MAALLGAILAAGCASTNAESDATLRGDFTLIRSGGIAGMVDQVVVHPDGSYRVSHRSGRPTLGTLSAARLTALAEAVNKADLDEPRNPGDACCDRYAYSFASGGSVVEAVDGDIPGQLADILDLALPLLSA